MTSKSFKAIREARDMTQADLARWIGVSTRTVQRYESGTKAVTGCVEQLMKVLAARVLAARKQADRL